MFENYRNRLAINGHSDKEAIKKQSVMAKEQAFDNSQYCTKVKINGEEYDARIYSDVDDTVKTGSGSYRIEFRSGDFFYAGTYVQMKNINEIWEWWLIIKTVDDLLFPKHLIKKCVYPLKWKNSFGDIIQRWCVFDDSYKIYAGIDNTGYKTNLPSSSLAVILPYDAETVNLKRDVRFLIDAEGIEDYPDAYEVSNRNAVTRIENGHGVVVLSLTMGQFNPATDNRELMVADYYVEPAKEPQSPVMGGTRAEITYVGKPRITMGTPYKEFAVHFYDANDHELTDITANWTVDILPDQSSYIDYTVVDNTLKIKAQYNENLINYTFKITGASADGTISAEQFIKVVSGI